MKFKNASTKLIKIDLVDGAWLTHESLYLVVVFHNQPGLEGICSKMCRSRTSKMIFKFSWKIMKITAQPNTSIFEHMPSSPGVM